ncbi:putative B3 domain-containing protein Os03g0621600 [Gastrolobium bilobum]|uniref:putative B3 domain-containing protein Os03g0621600 n=1 Tax=Gastrolobium bilobum TaxID=150636 RepID=UPI002AB195B4|nr:putative B3 domain-containing protein Os03g0621600 [Gastrolobium bilobum]
MTSKPDYRDGSNGDSAPKTIHFFRIIHPKTLLEGKLVSIYVSFFKIMSLSTFFATHRNNATFSTFMHLMLPIKFVRRYGESLPNTILLKLSSGAEWTVNLEKHDGRVWLQNGWKEFVEYHSLAYGHLLVFRYDGTSHFHVLIFDPSTMEIDYPFNILDPKRARNGELKSSKKRRTNGNSNKYESYSNLQDTSFHSTVKDWKGMVLDSKCLLKNPSEKKRNIDQRTEMSSNTSFTVEIKSWNLRKFIALPKGSLKGYVKPGGQNVTLLVGNRSWKVNLIYYPKKPRTCFSARWLIFARENDLKVGDVCLFELLECSDDDMVIKVSISKHSSVKP